MRLPSVVLVGFCWTAVGCFADAREFGEVLEGASGGVDDDDSGSESGAMAGVSVEASSAIDPILQVLVPEYIEETEVEVDFLITESNFAVDAVGNGRADVGIISRDLTDVERERHPEIELEPYALDGIAVVVNVDNPIDALSLEQLADIYSGRATSWLHVGGDDVPLVVFSRPPASEIGRVFGDAVLGETPLREDAEVLDSSGQMETAVSDNVRAIAYIGAGVVGTSVKTVTLEGVLPQPETVQGGGYPITRVFYVLTDGSPRSAASDFIDFVVGARGDEVLVDNGYLPAP